MIQDAKTNEASHADISKGLNKIYVIESKLASTGKEVLAPSFVGPTMSSDSVAFIEKRVKELDEIFKEKMTQLDGTLEKHIELVSHSMRLQEQQSVENANIMKRLLSEGQRQRISYVETVKSTCEKKVLENMVQKAQAAPELDKRDRITKLEYKVVQEIKGQQEVLISITNDIKN